MFGTILSWEASDPELQAEHFQTVAAYNLQHPAKFTDKAIAGLRTALVDYIDFGVSTRELRRQASEKYEGAKRVLRDEDKQVQVLKNWDMTVADVYANDTPLEAADRVRQWGLSIRREISQ
jgi:hypothetical protein